MIEVFFETSGYAELAAVYATEAEYMDNLPKLEKLAQEQGFERVTESIKIS